MSEVPEGFSVATVAQWIPARTLTAIDRFIGVFERVTTRPSWQRAVTADAPPIARQPRREVCFFSAWDFHLPDDVPDGWQLIEFNDNGSGLLFAALINHAFHALEAAPVPPGAGTPPDFAAFGARLLDTIEAEANAFFGEPPAGLFLILDDPESLAAGKFRDELRLLRGLLRDAGHPTEIAAPGELHWDGGRLRLGEAVVRFVVNRSTDFFWQADAFSALRHAYADGHVYVAPNPFSYATRSDKRLLEWLSLPEHDRALGILPEERAVLSAHVPETRRVDEASLDALVARKHELVFKPAHGFASRGLLPSDQVGRRRLRRLGARGERYVAQRRVPKRRLETAPDGSASLFADLRVWAHRGRRMLLSGRGSLRPDALDLRPPGGWLPSYAGRAIGSPVADSVT